MSVMIIGMASCSKNEYDPDDFVTSVLSGEYGKDRLWKLNVTENGTPTETEGYIRFDSKYLKEADFRFFNVIPGEKECDFMNIPLSATSSGYEFSMEYQTAEKKIIIDGTVSLGVMTVNLSM